MTLMHKFTVVLNEGDGFAMGVLPIQGNRGR